jgi:hypothetical protein
LQAYLRRELEDFKIVDKECVKPGFSDTLLIRATVRLSRCAGWLGLLCAVLNDCWRSACQRARRRALARRGCGVPGHSGHRGFDGVIKFEIYRPIGPAYVGVRWSAPVREPPSREP